MMVTIIVLLSINILLLAVIVAMMVTGWPGRERAGIESTLNALQRDMASHRSELTQALHAIRIDVEDSVKESIEREMAGFSARSGRSRASRGPGSAKGAKSVPQDAADEAASQAIAAPELQGAPEELTFEAILAARQLPLFGDAGKQDVPVTPVEPSARLSPDRQAPEPAVETIYMGYLDDIPDAE